MHLTALVRDRTTGTVTPLEVDATTYEAAKADVDGRVPVGAFVISYRIV